MTNSLYKVSKKDFSRFCSKIQNDYYLIDTFSINTKKPNGVVVTSCCLDNLEFARCVKSVDKRAEYYINPFFKEVSE